MITNVSIVIPITIRNNQLFVWMQKRLTQPFLGLWEFVGGKVEKNETPIQAAIREVYEEANVKLIEKDLYAFTSINTYPKSGKIIKLNVFITNKFEDFGKSGVFDVNEFTQRSDYDQLIPAPNLKLFEILKKTDLKDLNF